MIKKRLRSLTKKKKILTVKTISMGLVLRKCRACSTNHVVSCSVTSWTTQALPLFSIRRSSTCADLSQFPSIWKVDRVPLSVSTIAWLVVLLACWLLESIEGRLPNSWWTLLTSSRTRQVPCQRRFTPMQVEQTWKTKISFPCSMLFKESRSLTAHSRNKAKNQTSISAEETVRHL